MDGRAAGQARLPRRGVGGLAFDGHHAAGRGDPRRRSRAGSGARQMLDVLAVGRVNVACRALGIIDRALDCAIDEATEREIGAALLGDHSHAQLRIGEIRRRQLVVEAAIAAPPRPSTRAPRTPRERATAAKIVASESAVWAVDLASRLAASRSYTGGQRARPAAPRRAADADRRGRQRRPADRARPRRPLPLERVRRRHDPRRRLPDDRAVGAAQRAISSRSAAWISARRWSMRSPARRRISPAGPTPRSSRSPPRGRAHQIGRSQRSQRDVARSRRASRMSLPCRRWPSRTARGRRSARRTPRALDEALDDRAGRGTSTRCPRAAPDDHHEPRRPASAPPRTLRSAATGLAKNIVPNRENAMSKGPLELVDLDVGDLEARVGDARLRGLARWPPR